MAGKKCPAVAFDEIRMNSQPIMARAVVFEAALGAAALVVAHVFAIPVAPRLAPSWEVGVRAIVALLPMLAWLAIMLARVLVVEPIFDLGRRLALAP